MLGLVGLEGQIAKRERQLTELSSTIEALEEKTAVLLKELGVTSEQVRRFMEDPANFTEENWNSIQKQQLEQEERLNTLLANIPNPKESAKRQSERNVQPHWLFVR